MHVISRRAIKQAQQRYPNARSWLDGWWVTANRAAWINLTAVRAVYPNADEVGQCLIFNVCGNAYRLVCRTSYANQWNSGTMLVRHFLTHADYDKNKWRLDCLPMEKKK